MPPDAQLEKQNLEASVGHNASVQFMREDRRINIVLKEDILGTLDHLASEQQVEAKSREILGMSDTELFQVKTE